MVAFLQRERKFSNALLLRIPLRQMQAAAVAVLNGPLKAGEGFIFKFVPQFAKMKFCKNGLKRTNDSKVLFWPLFLLFRLFNNTVDNKQMFYIQVSQRLDSNCVPPEAEATTLPTAPQPLPNDSKMFITIF